MSAESKSSHVWSKVCGTTIHVLRTVTQVVRRDYPFHGLQECMEGFWNIALPDREQSRRLGSGPTATAELKSTRIPSIATEEGRSI